MLSSTFLQPCAHDKNMQQESRHEGHVLLVSYVSVIYFVYQHWTSLTLRCAALRCAGGKAALEMVRTQAVYFNPLLSSFIFKLLWQ